MNEANSISIYAELLSNIRQISVVASLPSTRDASTSAAVFADGTRLGVRHGGASKELLLPGKVMAPPVLPMPQNANARTLTWRLTLATSHPTSGPVSHDQYPMPWTALDMEPDAAVSCRKCKAVVIPRGTIKAWKDLPSENWAEMMEFWHCHKPDEDEHKDHDHLTTRGYGASSAMSVQQGVGLVDLTTFLFAEPDTSSLEYFETANSNDLGQSAGEESSRKILSVSCSQCDSVIGFYQTQKSAISLFKWQVDCPTIKSSKAPTSTDCLGAILTAHISRSGSSKSVVLPVPQAQAPSAGADASGSVDLSLSVGKKGEKALHAWVLNSHITYVSSQVAGSKTAIKLLYRVISRREAEELTDSLTSDVQELNMAEEALNECLEFLEHSNRILPAEQRVYKEWRVGLLDRYDS